MFLQSTHFQGLWTLLHTLKAQIGTARVTNVDTFYILLAALDVTIESDEIIRDLDRKPHALTDGINQIKFEKDETFTYGAYKIQFKNDRVTLLLDDE